jgi:hypothetical protein
MAGNKTTERQKLEEPAVKRSKLLGNIDENSEEFRMLMKSRSKHTGALAEVRAVRIFLFSDLFHGV